MLSMVDVPHICPDCGARYWVTGGLMDGAHVYSIEGSDGRFYDDRGEPHCPSCGALLVDEEFYTAIQGGEV